MTAPITTANMDTDMENPDIVAVVNEGDKDTNNNEPDNDNGTGDNKEEYCPLLTQYSPVVQEGDFVVLIFSDGRQLFAQAIRKWKGKSPPVKVNKRSYPTANLIGLPFGTVLELGPKTLIPLPNGEDIIPDSGADTSVPGAAGNEATNASATDTDTSTTTASFSTDNRNLVDNNTSQSIGQHELNKMQKDGTHGSDIVKALVKNSATFSNKTEFSKAKYIAKKQRKYQVRCRMVRPTARSVCELAFRKDPRKVMNLREDTLAQILSYANVYAGSQVLLMESCLGVLTGALAQRMGGYGKILSVYTGCQPSFLDILAKFNLSYGENASIKWVHAGEIFGEGVVCQADTDTDTNLNTNNEKSNDGGSATDNTNINTKNGDSPPNKIDWEARDRDAIKWPCELQPHTTVYLQEEMKTDDERRAFLLRRATRFARKLTRPTPHEISSQDLHHRSDSLILAVSKYDPVATLLRLLPFLAPSCPFVVLCEHQEPLVECFRTLQDRQLAINLRLTDTWMREFQVLPSRTHPHMNMSQSGGFLLTGVKLCPVHGVNDMDEETARRLRAEMGGRRGHRNKNNNSSNGGGGKDPSSKRRRGRMTNVDDDEESNSKYKKAKKDERENGSSSNGDNVDDDGEEQ